MGLPSRTSAMPARPARCCHDSGGLANVHSSSPGCICAFSASQSPCLKPNGWAASGYFATRSSVMPGFSASAWATVMVFCSHSFGICMEVPPDKLSAAWTNAGQPSTMTNDKAAMTRMAQSPADPERHLKDHLGRFYDHLGWRSVHRDVRLFDDAIP